MSRSYRKQPVVKDHNSGAKKTANRKVRHSMCGHGAAYKKLFCTYDICDWKFRETYREYQQRKERYEANMLNSVLCFGTRINLGESMSYWDWFKMYKRK